MATDFIIVGGGPAGLASAIFLSKKGYNVSIYEKNSHLEQQMEESYPIGINPRGMAVLEELEELVRKEGEKKKKRDTVLYLNGDRDEEEGEEVDVSDLLGLVDDIKREVIEGWSIYVYGWKVATFKSGTTCGATRGGVVKRLYHIAEREKNISFFFSHKLSKVDFEKKELVFEKEGEGEVVVEGESSRVIAGDGVWSKMRRELERYMDETRESEGEQPQQQLEKATIHPWGSYFRLLFTAPNAPVPLSPSHHHILNGTYVAVVEDKRWVVCVQLKEKEKGGKELMSDEASEENVKRLKKIVQEKVRGRGGKGERGRIWILQIKSI